MERNLSRRWSAPHLYRSQLAGARSIEDMLNTSDEIVSNPDAYELFFETNLDGTARNCDDVPLDPHNAAPRQPPTDTDINNYTSNSDESDVLFDPEDLERMQNLGDEKAATTTRCERRWIVLLVIAVVILSVLTAFVASDQSERNVPVFQPVFNTTEMNQEQKEFPECKSILDAFSSCPCSISEAMVTRELVARYHELGGLLNLDMPKSLLNITATEMCAFSNLALLWLAQTTTATSQREMPLQRLMDRFHLARFFAAFSGSEWDNNTLWLSQENECEWFGVTCGISSNSVIGLNLELNDLRGHTSGFDTKWLSQFLTLELAQNQINGPLPSLAALTNMRRLDLGDVFGLSGTVPNDVGLMTSLTYLFLQGNNLSGTVPTSIGLLKNLELLRLNNNRFQGGMLPLLKLSSLQWIDLSHNSFVFQIPNEINRLKNLTVFILNQAVVTGTLPSTLGDLPRVYFLSIRSNHLSGTVPSELGNLKMLQDLFLDENCDLTGGLPSALASLPKIQKIDVSGTRLTGSFPVNLPKISEPDGGVNLSCLMRCFPNCPDLKRDLQCDDKCV